MARTQADEAAGIAHTQIVPDCFHRVNQAVQHVRLPPAALLFPLLLGGSGRQLGQDADILQEEVGVGGAVVGDADGKRAVEGGGAVHILRFGGAQQVLARQDREARLAHRAVEGARGGEEGRGVMDVGTGKERVWHEGLAQQVIAQEQSLHAVEGGDAHHVRLREVGPLALRPVEGERLRYHARGDRIAANRSGSQSR